MSACGSGAISLWPSAEERAAVREIESLGYGAVWIGESHRQPRDLRARGHPARVHRADRRRHGRRRHLVARPDRLRERRGHARRGLPRPLRAHARRQPRADRVDRRGHVYARPYTAMREHLDGMAATRYVAAGAGEPAPLLLAALAPADDAPRGGAHGRRAPVPRHPGAHRGGAGNARAGQDPRARAGRRRCWTTRTPPARVAREHLAVYLPLENYTRCWRRLGFDDADLADGGSDRLVDALVAWGDEEASRPAFAPTSTRVRATCPCRRSGRTLWQT